MWPPEADEILRGDHALAFAYQTPARGVVLNPLTNLGLWDREAGTGEPVSSSVGLWRKLERIRANPRVALAYHAREHGSSERPEYVLVQGEATLSPFEERDWLERHLEAWERIAGPRDMAPLWERWLSAYHWRTGISVDVRRVTVWPDRECRGRPQVHGEPWPAEPPAPQRPPRGGTGPRIVHGRAARRAQRRPHVLLGWVGADGFPVAVSVRVAGAEPDGIRLQAADGLVPPGGRRAGLLAHSFARYAIGQHQYRHTGWLESGDDGILYAPHTSSGYWLPASMPLYRLAAGAVTRSGVRSARRAGFLPG